MENLRNKKAFICDMDGVIYHGNKLLPGVLEFSSLSFSTVLRSVVKQMSAIILSAH